jgi:hypothetical protein
MGRLPLQPRGRDTVFGDRHARCLERALRSVRPGPTKSDFHLRRAGARADQLYISPIRATGVKGSNRRIHRERRSVYCPLQAQATVATREIRISYSLLRGVRRSRPQMSPQCYFSLPLSAGSGAIASLFCLMRSSGRISPSGMGGGLGTGGPEFSVGIEGSLPGSAGCSAIRSV